MNLRELKERIALAWRIIRDRDDRIVYYARQELAAIGMNNGDEMNEAMAQDVVDLVRVFSTQGHSGFSANYCVGIVSTLLQWQPLAPLSGADDEWVEVHEGVRQNKRCSRVFKEADGKVYDIDAVVFEEPEGCRYTGRHSRQPVKFPYTPRTVVVKVTDEMDDDAISAAAAVAWSAA